MAGKWQVTSQLIGGKTMYAVYQLCDITKLDHSGNRNYATGYSTDREFAEAEAVRLNKEDGR